LVEREKQLEQMREDLEREKLSLHNQKVELEEFTQKLVKQESELKGKLNVSSNSKSLEELEKARKVVADLLKKSVMMEKERARWKSLQECHRLGQIVSERHGTQVSEIWQDGQAFKDLNKLQNELKEGREKLEAQKKEYGKAIKKKLSEKLTPQSEREIDELSHQQEIYALQLGANKKATEELNIDREKLMYEKNLHLRELKRIHDEEQSRFNNCPILGPNPSQKRYILLQLLGKGGFSEVYKAFDLYEFREVACKIHQLNNLWSDKKKENYVKHACREYNIHKSVVHPRIVRLYDVFEIDENSFCTVLEYCEGQDLDFYLKTQQTLSEREAKSIVSQIFSGLEYLNRQKRPIIHYDLKPGNILFSKDGIKITDFGLSKIMEEDQEFLELTSQGAGTYWYLPPECFETGKDPPKISSKVDVWSVGVIFYQMLYGKKPFGNNVSQQKILTENIIANSTLEFPPKPVVSKEAKDFIAKCLTHNILARPDVFTCCNDPYLKVNKKKEKHLEKSS